MPERDLDGQKWDIPDVPAALIQSLSGAIHAGLLASTVLVSRGFCGPTEARRFLDCSLSDLHDPLLLKDMSLAVERLRRALEAGERLFVHGDYDADGVCAAALLIRCLTSLGADVCYHLPHRIEEGYGVSARAIQRAAAGGASLMITADCGISAFQQVALARDLGLDVIVTDHHLALPERPPALAVINPMQADCDYPCKELSGVGVAFKLGQALSQELGLQPERYIRAFADLVAIGTVADVVPLIGENRVLVRAGLALLPETKKVGLRALAEVSDLRGTGISARDVAFRLAPRLNAAGRLEDARHALELLLTADEPAARRLAVHLDAVNRRRQQLEQAILAQALAQLEDDEDLDSRAVIVLHDESWHTGVTGIVASKVLERLRRPVVLFGAVNGEWRGSARSIPGFHVAEALAACSDLLTRHGGHELAAGLTLSGDQMDAFRERINRLALERLGSAGLTPTLKADAAMPLEALRPEDVEELSALGPFGEGNPEPLFVTSGLSVLSAKRVGAEGQHLRLVLARGGRTAGAIAFKKGQWLDRIEAAPYVDVCYTPVVDTWNGSRAMQLKIEAVRVRTGGGGD